MIVYRLFCPTMHIVRLEVLTFSYVEISSSSHLWLDELYTRLYAPAQRRLKVNNYIAALTGQSGSSRSCDSKEKTMSQFVSGPLLVSYEKGSCQRRAGNFFVPVLQINCLRTRFLPLTMLSGSILPRRRYTTRISSVLWAGICQLRS